MLRAALLLSLLAPGSAICRSSAGPAPAEGAATWRVDPTRSEVRFRIRHLVTRVTGRFTAWDATIRGGPGAWNDASVDAVIRTHSIDTGDARRDAHLRSPDFFSADSFPTIRFQSTRVRVDADGRLAVAGDLTIRETTRPVTLTGRISVRPGDPARVRFAVTTTLNRLQFGISWNRVAEGGGLMLADDVVIEIEGEAVRADGP